METKVKSWMGNSNEFGQSRKRSIVAATTIVGAAVGFTIATSKVGLFVAGAIGVVFAVTTGAIAGRVVGEVLSRRPVEYIPSQN